MKSILTFILAIVVVLIIPIYPAYASNDGIDGIDKDRKEINVAVIGPLTGKYAAYGHDQRRGIEVAVKHFNESGGVKSGILKGYKIKARYFDDKSDTRESANVAQMVVMEDFLCEIGPTNSSPASASAPIFDRNNMAMLLVYAGDTRLTHCGYNNIFRLVLTTDTISLGNLKNLKNKLKANKVVEIWENSAYGQGIHAIFVGEAKKIGLEVVGSETFVPGQDLDFKAIITKLRTLNPDFVMLDCTYNDGGLIVSQARSMGWNVPMLCDVGCNSPKFIEMLPEDPGEIYLSVLFNQLSQKPEIKKYVQDFTDFHGIGPSEASALAYDAVTAVIRSIDLGATSRQDLVKYLRKVNFKGVTNLIRFDKNGDVLQPDLSLLKLEPGKVWVNY